MKRALLIKLVCAALGMLLLFFANGCGGSGGGEVIGDRASENTPPESNAGADRAVFVGTSVMLDGGHCFDIDGDPLAFAWTLQSSPDGSNAALTDADTAYPTMTTDVTGTYVVRLVVTDSMGASAADTAVITASQPGGGNTGPVAYAGPDLHPGVNTLVTLDGSASYDMDGDALTYLWYLNSKPNASNAVLSDRYISNPTFTPDVPGMYYIALVVNDGKVDSYYADHAVITAVFTNVANAGPDQYLVTGPSVSITLDGSASYDSSGKSLTYAWTFQTRPVGSNAAISDPAAVNPTFTADLEGKYVLSLVVNNSLTSSVADTVTIIVVTDRTIAGLNFKVIDAEYSKQLDKIIMVSGTPNNQLHIYDPESGLDTTVDLAAIPTSVSVGPEGTHAAVGHNGSISYVDLASPALVKTLTLDVANMSDIVLAGNGHIYAFPGERSLISCVNIETGTVTMGAYLSSSNTRARLHPSGSFLYASGEGTIQKFDISAGTAVFLYQTVGAPSYSSCGDHWMAEDGSRLFTRCGGILTASTGTTPDLLPPIGRVPGPEFIRHLTHISAGDRLMVVPEYEAFSAYDSDDTELWVLGNNILEKLIPLQRFSVNSSLYAGHGRFVFSNSAVTKMFVVIQADGASGLANDYGIVTY